MAGGVWGDVGGGYRMRGGNCGGKRYRKGTAGKGRGVKRLVGDLL